MKKLLNTLYIASADKMLSLESDNVVVKEFREGTDGTVGKQVLLRVPLITLEAIVTCGYAGATPALMGRCAELGIGLTFLSRSGRFLANVVGEERGSILVRKKQYRLCIDEYESCLYARNFILGKVFNAKWVLQRTLRDHSEKVSAAKISNVSDFLTASLEKLRVCDSLDKLRGLEGESAKQYFSVFDELIIRNKSDFKFTGRSRRPPLDNINALLSFAYTLLASDCRNALYAAGLEPYSGFLHRDRPGRAGLSLDLMEELRPIVADRFVLTLINRGEITSKDFEHKENGAVFLCESGRRAFYKSWQEHKTQVITHPFLNEKIAWGLVPYAQSLLLSRVIRGDLPEYPVFLWK
ncbi:CRISPR-associated endonuclease Cas1 [Clostridia bacterium]|nr:CRISPR-associated endonuclease Cas1 [Clostridia bacterium]